MSLFATECSVDMREFCCHPLLIVFSSRQVFVAGVRVENGCLGKVVFVRVFCTMPLLPTLFLTFPNFLKYFLRCIVVMWHVLLPVPFMVSTQY